MKTKEKILKYILSDTAVGYYSNSKLKTFQYVNQRNHTTGNKFEGQALRGKKLGQDIHEHLGIVTGRSYNARE